MPTSTMDGRDLAHRLLRRVAPLVIIALAALLPPAASALAPQERWPAEGAAVARALDVAAQQWGARACGGAVDVLWEPLAPNVNARAAWVADRARWADPAAYRDCEIDLSTAASWDWPKLCTVIVHEAGHLAGHEHSEDPFDVMFGEYVLPLPACAVAQEPPQPAARAARPMAKHRLGATAATKRKRPTGPRRGRPRACLRASAPAACRAGTTRRPARPGSRSRPR